MINYIIILYFSKYKTDILNLYICEQYVIKPNNYKSINAMPPLYDSNNDPYNYDYHTLTIIL